METQPLQQVEVIDEEIPYAERTKEWLIDYIGKLEKTLKQQWSMNKKLYDDNCELSKKCLEHFNMAQRLIRYELKVPEGQEQLVRGETGSGLQFTVNRKTGELKRI